MLTALGFGMVITFMYLIMSKRLSPLVALITVPIVFALLGGFGTGINEMMLDGIKKIAPTGVMLMFAILYFGVMIDAGLFDPLVGRILRLVKGDPLKIVMGTAILTMLISLDGDGSTTYMITVSAMLPLYQRLGMNALNLTCVTILASGVMNLTPWGGPTARAATHCMWIRPMCSCRWYRPWRWRSPASSRWPGCSACASVAAWAWCACRPMATGWKPACPTTTTPCRAWKTPKT